MPPFSKNLGPVDLDYKGTSAGETFGGTQFKVAMNTAKSMIDKQGETARTKTVTGTVVTVETAVTEATLAQLVALYSGAAVSGTRAHFGNPVGTDLVESAGVLILKPIVNQVVSITEADWIYVPKASVVPNFDVPLILDNQRVWGVIFEGHPVTAVDIATGGDLFGLDFSEGDLWAGGV